MVPARQAAAGRDREPVVIGSKSTESPPPLKLRECLSGVREIAFAGGLAYDCNMPSSSEIRCDGCGQLAAGEHIARRLKRLENMTRYRPIHVQALFLGAMSPVEDRDHLYSAVETFHGEGAEAVRALGVEQPGRNVAETLAGLQRMGFLLTHVLDCPVNDAAARREALQARLPATLARIRRSYKPKRVVLVGGELSTYVTQIAGANLDAVVVLQNGKPYEWTGVGPYLLAKEAAAPLEALW